jgi:PadR family transcriptional regulator PadR
MLARGDSYGYKLAKSNGIAMSESTLYPILHRLEQKAYLKSYSRSNGSKLRKFYQITATGREQLVALKEHWAEFKKTVDSFLSE